MDKLWLALLPSLQDTNRVIDPATNGPTNELAQIAHLTDCYEAEINTTYSTYDITYRRFDGAPYSQDHTHLESLYKQQRAARAWLDTAPAGYHVLSLNLHSDAPGAGQPATSWVAYCYDQRTPDTKPLGIAICKAIAPIFETTRIVAVDYTTYVEAEVMASSQRIIPLLIEHGDHASHHDNVVLLLRSNDIARASLKAIIDYFGVVRHSLYSAESKCPDGTGPIGQELAEYLNTHAALKPRTYTEDGIGDKILYLEGTTDFLFFRRWNTRVYHIV